MHHPAAFTNHNSSLPRRAPRFLALLAGLALLPALNEHATAQEPPVQPAAIPSVDVPPTLSTSIAYSSTWWLRVKACLYIIYHILGGPGGEDLTPPELAERAHALFESGGWPSLSSADAAMALNAINGLLGQLQAPPDDLEPGQAGQWSVWALEMRRALPSMDPAQP